MSDEGWRAEVAGSWEQAYARGTVAVADIVTNVAALDVDVPGVRYLESVALASDAWPEEQERLEPFLTNHPEHRPLAAHPLHAGHRSPRPVRSTSLARRSAGCTLISRRRRTRTGSYAMATVRSSVWAFATELRDGAGQGRSPAEYLDSLEGLGADVHVAHGTHLNEADRKLLRSRGTAVALCARSNAILGAGIPPVAALLREGSPIAVGTDSLASTPDLDLLAEARALAAVADQSGIRRAGPGDPDPARLHGRRRLRDRPVRPRRPRARARWQH